MKLQALIILSLLFVFSCKTSKNAAKMANTDSVLIAKGNLYGSGSEGIEKQNTIIDNQSDWENLMAQMNSVNKVSDTFTETKIDFENYIAVAVFDDVKGSGGHSLELEVTTTSEKRIVNIIRTSPEGHATMVMTQPFCIVILPKTDAPIEFQ
ncbi:hypothetical protein DFQ11_101964 [Winogradskyella epiphytica]|uniref:Protease stability complex PrcB-like protein n=1 Tax=Winogradskyella epiphytica TaxID=262005 RepID=A0A2V4XXK9_9FLAO|nr:hypothetical protein [Winogradskyella epiphytica]PYE83527.1 hypothetical protein DFQ11_101964 [Winogradskyella epiphytica]GGW58806.1 hypothetical protein GCM10008085_08200 [Winogradskyella epiphytica]